MLHHFKKVFLMIAFFGTGISIYAQEVKAPAASILPMELAITNNETSVLIFPHAIKGVDRGSKEIRTKVVKDVSNVLKLRAATENIAPTNLHVFTGDGRVYAFNIIYNQAPANLTIDLTNAHNIQGSSAPVKFIDNRLNDALVEQCAEAILTQKPLRKSPKSEKKGDAQLSLLGTYLKDGVLFFHLSLTNKAQLPYQIDFVRSYIRDKKKTKRSSITEHEVTPLFKKISNEGNSVRGNPAGIVLAFDQFTIADGKYLAIEGFEKNGDRVLTCKLKGKHLLNVKKLDQRP
ncbi:conjugative transposon protein TraN [Niabella sp.]|uniref:conjugative transposon protein TraN n=1 Tax=Niabella sp. TaxID=1962976 RepID=UPI0026063CA8|nr:conjugative transposon protein TraN [Niabella sp.]